MSLMDLPSHCRIVPPEALPEARASAARSARAVLNGVLLTAQRSGDERRIAEITAELAVLDLDVPPSPAGLEAAS